MRNLLDKASDAQSLDGNRLTGSLQIPVRKWSTPTLAKAQERADSKVPSGRLTLRLGDVGVSEKLDHPLDHRL